MKKQKLKFTGDSDESFFPELRKEVYGYFRSNNIPIHANTQMFFKTIFFFSVFTVSYALIIFSDASAVIKLVMCFLHGIAIAGIGFNISHDCSHNAYFKKKKYNRWLSYSMDLVGSNSYMWDLKHNKAHHIYTNIESFDEDIKGSYLLRLSPHAPFHAVNRLQFIYAWPLYCFLYFYIVWVYNFIQFKAEKLGPFIQIKHSRKEWIKLITWKLFYLFYAVIFPIYWLDISIAVFLLGYGIACATTGFLLGVTFYLAHCVENGFEFPLPQNDQIKAGWARHQMETTSNFAMGNRFITWFCGGLNYQVEHHLFPEICSIHYNSISRIVQKISAEHQLPYKYYEGLGSAIASHYKVLKRFSSPNWSIW
jgi:linoleoyl-CoA desaturase